LLNVKNVDVKTNRRQLAIYFAVNSFFFTDMNPSFSDIING